MINGHASLEIGQVFRARVALPVTCWWWLNTVAILDDYAECAEGSFPAGESFVITQIPAKQPHRVLCRPLRARELKSVMFPSRALEAIMFDHQIEVIGEITQSKCERIA
jgi:hypothetical protein